KLPGGKLMPCTISRETTVPAGRSSKLGDGMNGTPVTVPSSSSISAGGRCTGRSVDVEPFHAITQCTERDAQEFRRRSAIEARLVQRLQDRFTLDAVQIVLQRPLGVGRHCYILGKARRRQMQILRVDLRRGGQGDGALQHIL